MTGARGQDPARVTGADYRRHGEEILSEQVRQLYSLAPLGIVATLINSVLAFVVMNGVMPNRVLAPWLSAILTLSVLRSALIVWYRSTKPGTASAATWERRFLFSSVLIGLAWGSVGFVPFGFSIAHQVFLAFVLGGMSAGASATFSKVKYGYAAFALPALLPLTLHFFLFHDDFHRAMGAMTLLYLILLSRIASHNFSVNRTSLLLRFENQEMIESLKRAKEAVEGLNTRLMAEIGAKLEAEAELRAHHERLERMVEERTEELSGANEQLRSEIEERKQIEADLRESRERLVLAQQKLSAAKDAAEAGSKAKSEFLANMSHEMRTPLAGALGMIKLVLDMEIGAEERELLEMAKRSAGSLQRIIGDLLDFSRLEAGMMQFESAPYAPAEVVKSAVEVVSLSAWERGLKLSWRVADEVPGQLLGDAGRVRQVLVNLLGNAVKFTDKGEIEVTARPLRAESGSAGAGRSGGSAGAAASAGSEAGPAESAGDGFILFSVRDTGVGIPAHQLEQIFGKFTQLDSSLTRRHGGTGLGLALSRQIVEKMGGRLWAESSPGSGSTFHFTVPAAS